MFFPPFKLWILLLIRSSWRRNEVSAALTVLLPRQWSDENITARWCKFNGNHWEVSEGPHNSVWLHNSVGNKVWQVAARLTSYFTFFFSFPPTPPFFWKLTHKSFGLSPFLQKNLSSGAARKSINYYYYLKERKKKKRVHS